MADIKKKKAKAKESYSKEGDKAKSAKKPFAYHLIPYIFAVLAVLLLLCFITNLFCNPGNILHEEERQDEHTLGLFGYWVSVFFMGVLGPAAFAVPVLLFLFVIFWKNYNRRSFVALNAVLAFIAATVCSALIHVFENMGDGREAFANNISILYWDGAALEGGGVIGGFVSYALVSLMNVVGTTFVLIAILIPIVLFLFGTTPVEVVLWLAAKIKASSEKGKERRKERKLEKEIELRERREREKEERAAQKEQERIEREQAREQERIEREQAKEQARLERERAAAEKATAKAVAEQHEDDEDGTALVIPAEMKKDDCVIRVTDSMDEDEDDAHVSQLADAEEDEDKLTLTAFPEESGKHTDHIKTSRREKLDADEQDELGAEQVFPAEADEDAAAETVVFVNPKDTRARARGMGTVDDLVSDRFDSEDEEQLIVDKNTGEVFTPAVQNKKIKSADEFRAQTETHEEQFLGEKSEPAPIPEYKFPPVDLLEMGPSKYSSDPAEIEQNAQLLRDVLQDFRIPIREITCSCGPTITRYEIKPEAGVRVRQIAGLVDDIAMALAKSGVRIEAPIPGKAAVGIEVPNDKSTAVKLRNLIENPDFVNHKSKLAACLGADVSGKPVVFDIEKMPHLLVAGTTGSGKSVCINSIIMSILYHAKPSEVKLLLIDPKKVEFKIYKDIPHLCCRIVSDPKKAAGALNSAVNEMEKRFELIEEVGVRNITGYNEVTKNDPDKPYMPRMVIIIDEFADLMMTAKDEVETAVVRIAQKARAAGIHLIVGTQRPSVDVITGLIKANIPSRIAFTVMSGVDSRTILDTVGAEKLCGRGDMLYAPVGSAKPQRVQGTFVSDEEVEKVVDYVRDNNAPVIYDNEFENLIEMEAAKCGNAPEKSGGSGGDFKGGAGEEDPKLFEAAELAIDAGKISTSLLQRRLEVGYGRAAKIIDRLEEMGMVGPADGNKPRKILITKEELAERMMNQE
ncbi:MAG: DNA translocase FtsK 4TM domain-containing protein [Clostridia bacterium]|nr:DNA translocase FtsK 4TM domain-containing protein [Clostridia bacterium]